MRISDWSSDVCSSDLLADHAVPGVHQKHVIAIADPAQMARRGPMKPIMPGIGDDVARAVIGGRYTPAGLPDRESGVEGKSVSVSVALGGRRILKKQK